MAHVSPIARVSRRQPRYEVGPDIFPAIEISPGYESKKWKLFRKDVQPRGA
jgi:hypothetical protein